MNSGVTTERVYETVKAMLIGRGVRPGARLDPQAFATALGSSVTPVRDALHVMTGEALVETRLHEGFYAPNIDGPGLRDLYAWNLEILRLALRAGARRGEFLLRPAETENAADQIGALFMAVAERSSNVEHARAIRQTNDRLHAARLIEASLFADIPQEMANLAEAWEQAAVSPFRRPLEAYHRRRIKACAEIVRHLYRDERNVSQI